MVERASAALEQSPPWLAPLCARMIEQFAAPPADGDELTSAIYRDAELRRAVPHHVRAPRIRKWFFPQPAMTPKPAKLAGLALPRIETEGELVERLALTAGELDWYEASAQDDAALDLEAAPRADPV